MQTNSERLELSLQSRNSLLLNMRLAEDAGDHAYVNSLMPAYQQAATELALYSIAAAIDNLAAVMSPAVVSAEGEHDA